MWEGHDSGEEEWERGVIRGEEECGRGVIVGGGRVGERHGGINTSMERGVIGERKSVGGAQ